MQPLDFHVQPSAFIFAAVMPHSFIGFTVLPSSFAGLSPIIRLNMMGPSPATALVQVPRKPPVSSDGL